MTRSWLTLLVLTILVPADPAGALAAEITLASGGNPQAVIVVPEGTMADDVKFPRGVQAALERMAETRRQLLRDSARDLAGYLRKMSAAEFEIVETFPAGDRRIPILLGQPAERVFGPAGISKGGAFGFRVAAHPQKGIGLYGESEHGTSYAIYELLHRLGCRWYMPTALGECIPERKTLTVPIMDEKLAPSVERRGMSQGGVDWNRRNRYTFAGGLAALPSGGVHRVSYAGNVVVVAAGHNMLWRLVPKELSGRAFKWTDPALAEGMADTIIAEIDGSDLAKVLAAGYPVHYRLNMPDGQFPTEDPEERKHDPEPRVWEPAAGRWSITDRLVLLANRIQERVAKKYPGVHIGLLGYVNHSMPPARVKPVANLTWTIAPIDFNRFHPMDWPDHPNEFWLRDMVQGWGKLGVPLGAYWYGINLAELSAPCPFIAKWGTDLRILRENNLVNWTPETMNGWDTMLPAYVLASRMTFDASETPEEILAELWERFYGPAAAPMARYWTGIDQAYLDAHEYAGSPFCYLKVFTPEVMAAARKDLAAARAAAGPADGLPARRVKLIDESFTLFEKFMAMRNDWAAGKITKLDTDYEAWRTGVVDMIDRYRDPADPTCVGGRLRNPSWSDRMTRPGYADGSRIEKEFIRLGSPLLEWKWQHNPGPEADSLEWTKPEHDDTEWKTTHVVRDTWSSLGHHHSLTDEASGKSGRMAYRATASVPSLPAGKRAFLWIGSTDGRAKLFVNGRHVKYVVPEKTKQHEVGTVLDAFDGYCQPARFEITDAVKDGDNQITILAERHDLNELGTGGIMGPVVLFHEQ
jgi:hypothetical protein